MKDITKGNIFKTLLLFSLPLIFSGLLSRTYNLVDIIIAGKTLGDDALSVLGCSTTFIQFLSAIFWGFGVGLSTLTGILFGKEEKEKIVKLSKTGISTITAVMFLICLFCVIFATNIMDFLKVDPDIIVDAILYFRIFMLSLFFQSFYYQIICIFQSVGDSRFPMIITLITSGINIILDLLFVLVFKLGVMGLAIATVIASFVGLVYALIKMMILIKKLNGNFKWQYSFQDLGSILKISLPCILQQISLYASSIGVQPLINKIGKEATSGYSIAMNINLVLDAIYHGVARAVATFASQSKGAKKYKNYNKGNLYGLLLMVVLCAPFIITIFIVPKEICLIFLNNKSSASIPYAIQYVYCCLPFLVFLFVGNLLHSFFKAVESIYSVLISTTIFTIARLLFTYFLPNNEYIFSVYIGLGLAWVIEAIVLTIIYYTGIWKSKEQKEEEKLLKETTILE